MFEFNRATGNDHLGAVFAATAQRQQDAHLHEIGRTMRRSHARQWHELRQVYRDRDTGKFREAFLNACAALRNTQARQREELRTAWDTRNAERHAARAPFADHEATRRTGRAYGQGLTRSRHGDDRFGGPGRDAPKPD